MLEQPPPATPHSPRGQLARYSPSSAALTPALESAIPQALMGPDCIVISDIGASDVIQMPQTETKQVIQALPLETLIQLSA